MRVIRFSRNIGYQRSLLAAYKAATGDCSVQIDCDLQDPPHLIPDMLALWRQGNQVVYGIRRSLKDDWHDGNDPRGFYRLVQRSARTICRSTPASSGWSTVAFSTNCGRR